MSAKRFVLEAERTSWMPSKGFQRFDRCVCHPLAWGKKKGFRRARRRVSAAIIRREMRSY